MTDQSSTPDDYLAEIAKAVEVWKSTPPSVVGKALSTVLSPLSWIIGKVVPTSAIMGVLTGFDWVAKNTLSSAGSPDFRDLRECDRRADQVQNFHIALATAEGGAAGFFGFVAMPVDIPAVLTLAMRVVRQVGVEYGFAEDNEAERDFCLGVLQGASANTMEEKVAAQFVMAEVAHMVATKTWKSMAERAATNMASKEAAMTALRSLAKQIGVNITKRKALEAIPIMGSVIGAASNAWFLRDVGITAQMSFRERWLTDNAKPQASPTS